MATTIVTKSGSGAPTASNLVAGELAVDLTNKRLYTENSSGTVLELGTNPASDVTFGDNTKAVFGDGSDLRIYHTGSHSTIENIGTGHLQIHTTDFRLKDSAGTESMILANADGNVQLYYDNAEKLATTATGIDVTGTVTADGLTVDTDTLVVDATNNRVGIGTASPISLLTANNNGEAFITIRSSDTGNAGIQFGDQSDSVQGAIYQNATDNSLRFNGYNNSEAMRLDATGKLGLGTASPSSILSTSGTDTTVYSSSSVGGQDSSATLKIQNLTTAANSFASIDFNTNNNRVVNRIVSGHANSTTDGFLAFVTEGGGVPAERMRLDASGNLGLGTASPANKLDVYSGSFNSAVAHFTGASAGRGLLLSTFARGSNDDSIDYDVPFAGGAQTWSIAGAEKLRLDQSGNLLVGCTSAMGGGGSDGINGFSAQGSGGGRFVAIQNTTDSNMYIAKNSGYTNSNFILFYAAGTPVGGIVTNGTTTAYNTSSDQRLKENIADADDAGSKIDAIQVRKFDWKADGSHQDYGMVAQELIEVAPEAVSAPEDPEEMMGVDYSKLVPMMLKEIQSLRARIAALES
jgi:hypothetical protein